MEDLPQVNKLGLLVEALSPIAVELTWGVDGIDADSIVVVPVVVIRVVVDTTTFPGTVSGSFCEVGGPQFNNDTHSIMISGSLLLSSH